jgi:nucleoid DNA-binding protein
VNIIIEQVAKDLINNQIVSAKHFGTLSPYLNATHLAHDLSTGQVRELPTSKSVKFHPHESFLSLLVDREERFRGNGSGNRE